MSTIQHIERFKRGSFTIGRLDMASFCPVTTTGRGRFFRHRGRRAECLEIIDHGDTRMDAKLTIIFRYMREFKKGHRMKPYGGPRR